ncbi:hypothetical protein [Streptomyces shenzhenensis]|nr:hypothetical protein [Streptomyces shenzhenensis]
MPSRAGFQLADLPAPVEPPDAEPPQLRVSAQVGAHFTTASPEL